MLVTTKATTINGTSKLSTGEVIATMQYSIKENGKPVSTSAVANEDLYEQNKDLVRADMDEFTAYCRKIEDANTTEEEVTE